MKATLSLIAFLLYASISLAQILPQTPWTWMKGDNTVNQVGIYGTMGVANTNNKPGARNASTTWRDAAGNLWLFGGSGFGAGSQGYLNDLWKYEPLTGKWTWVKGDNTTNQFGEYGIQGSSTIANKPGASYSSVSWTDASGKLWLFGGFGFGNASMGLLNCLWKYDPETNQWTWVKGSSGVDRTGIYSTQGITNAANEPGARYGSQTWTDANGILWLFGGYGYAASSFGILNDLWKYNPTTNQWTWVKGDNAANQFAIYGTKAVANNVNKPGARYVSTSWQDASGDVWMFGGYGFDENYAGNLNDMWKYNPTTNQWTWMHGDKLIDQKSVFGIQGIPAVGNKPGSRYVSSSWKDANGELLMFGGYGYDAINSGYLNDFWKYNTTTNRWTWVKGDNTVDQRGIYGIQGMADIANKSGARTGSVSWSDGIGNLWLFGGYGYDGSSSGILNDLWKINNNQLILPLQLLSFNGVLNNNAVHLNWQSEHESNFSHFNLERSTDGNTFTSIGNVNGAGNSRNNYNFIDNDLQSQPIQKIFYRLKMADKDKQFSYSKIIRFDLKQSTRTITVFPNPATSYLTLSFEQSKKGNAIISITDMAGRTVKSINAYLAEGKNSQHVEINALPAATYSIIVRNENGIMQQTFIKN